MFDMYQLTDDMMASLVGGNAPADVPIPDEDPDGQPG